MATLDLNSISMNKPGAWNAGRSLASLLQAADKRGDNLLLPYVPGRVSLDQEDDQSVRDLSLVVQGFKDHAGATHSSHSAGLIANALYLRTNIFSVKTTMPAVFHTSSGDLSATVQVRNDVVTDIGGVFVITFDLIIPAGAFA